MNRAFLFFSAFMTVSGCVTDESIAGYDDGGIWHLTDLDGHRYEGRATLTFAANGKVSGQGACRNFTAYQTVPLPWIHIDKITPSGTVCADAPAEQAYFTALGAMTLAEISGPTLLMQNYAGREMLFTKTPDG